MCLHFSKMSNIEHRAVIMFFTRKGLNAIEISKKLDNVYKDSAPSYRTVSKWVAEFNNPERAFEDALRMGHPSTITADENIEVVERIVMRDQQISVRRLAEELAIPKTTIHEVINNHMGMKKVCTWWVPKLLTPIQRANHVDCYQELLHESKVNPANFFHSIVTGDESWIHHYAPLSGWKPRSGRGQVNKHQLDCAKKDQLERLWWSFSGIKMVFCSPSICHMEPRSMVLIIHQSLNDCVLSLWRNGEAKLAKECCFFMTTHPFTSATLFRLLFNRVASLNSIIVPILQILHRLITIRSQTWRNFFVARILALIHVKIFFYFNEDFLREKTLKI